MWFYESSNKYVREFLIYDYKYSIAKICACRKKTIHTKKIRQSLQLDRPPYIKLTNFLKFIQQLKLYFSHTRMSLKRMW